MLLSANDVIEKAMVKARIIYPGEGIPAGKAAQVFDDLNSLLESWSLENLMVTADVLESFSLIPGQLEYTYGEGGDFDSPRPLSISGVAMVKSGGVEYPCRGIPIDSFRVINKSVSGRPSSFAYNPDYPLIAVYFHPIPDAVDEVQFRVSKELSSFEDRTTQVDLAPGMSRAITSNLAVEICPAFGKKIPQALAYQAEESKRSIKSVNSRVEKRMYTPHLSAITRRRWGRSILNGPWR